MTSRLSDKGRSLLGLLADGNYHSGQALAGQLQTSRTTIWNLVNELENTLQLKVSAVSGKGYRLERPLELLQPERIRAGLPAGFVPRIMLDVFDCIDSTNAYLAGYRGSGNGEGYLCVAEMQTAGRGRAGRQWVSPFAANLYLSLAWHYPVGPEKLGGLSLATSVAVLRTLQQLGIRQARLKWPNDILYAGRKLGGILIELRGDSHGPCDVVIGIGLNHRMSGDAGGSITQPWIDLLEIMGQERCPGRHELLETLLRHLLDIACDFDQQGLAPYLDEWRAGDAYVGQEVTLYMGDKPIHGVVQGISSEGYLLLDSAGKTRTYAAGEISFRSGPHLPAAD